MGPVKPPVYEVSARKIIKLFFVLCLYTSCLVIFAIVSRSLGPLLLLLISLFIFGLYAAIEYYSVGGIDIPSEFYHPDLLPHKEYLALKRKYEDAENGYYTIKCDGLPLTEKEEKELLKDYREVVHSLKPILEAQNELRLLCRFKTLFGYIETRAVYNENFDWEKQDSDDESITGLNDLSITDIHDFAESENENVTNEELVATTEVIEAEKSIGFQPPQPFEITVQTSENESHVTCDMLKIFKKQLIWKK
uniref:Uncharacterized protein n=1 Tax=Panagrolaimus davidi TaxID=227884 RepID=A0A914R0A1_9BILA